jgi:allantoin racemase
MADILWVNPVGTGAFDAEVKEVIDRVRSPEHIPHIRHLETGPVHVEYHLYENATLLPTVDLIRQAEADGFGAAVLGSFYDGCLTELREAVKMPVVGQCEPTVHFAATLGHRFSIIVGRRKWIPKMHDNVVQYGLGAKLASFRSVDMGVEELAARPEEFAARVIEAGVQAVEEDGAEVIVLCELVPLAMEEKAKAELSVPLINPGAVCWKWAEMAADLYLKLGVSHGRAFGYESPPAGEYFSW